MKNTGKALVATMRGFNIFTEEMQGRRYFFVVDKEGNPTKSMIDSFAAAIVAIADIEGLIIYNNNEF